MDSQTDQNGAPVIGGLSRKIRTLERRRDALKDRLDNKRGTSRSLSFDQAEFEALESALDAMKFHWVSVSNLDTPLTALQVLAEAVESGSQKNIAEGLVRAREVLADF